MKAGDCAVCEHPIHQHDPYSQCGTLVTIRKTKPFSHIATFQCPCTAWATNWDTDD